MKTNFFQRDRVGGAQGFTMMELLIVVAVVGVLVTCLMLMMPAIKSQGMRLKCASNLRQVGTALLQYVQDQNGRFPALDVPNYGNADGIWFLYGLRILPYLGLEENDPNAYKVFTCPVNKRTGIDRPNYLFNSGNQYQPGLPGLAGVNLVSVRRPTETMMLFELAAIFPASWHDPKPGVSGASSEAKAMAAFVDGHVAYLPIFWKGQGLTVESDPPSSYGYKWSAD